MLCLVTYHRINALLVSVFNVSSGAHYTPKLKLHNGLAKSCIYLTFSLAILLFLIIIFSILISLAYYFEVLNRVDSTNWRVLLSIAHGIFNSCRPNNITCDAINKVWKSHKATLQNSRGEKASLRRVTHSTCIHQ